jgi:hypothetical protein
MAKLEQLFPDFLLMQQTEMETFFASYHDRRAQDLLSETRFAKKESRKGAGEKLQDKLSPEELVMMKKLGLKLKDITSLVSAMQEETDEEETSGDEEELIEE